MRKDEGYLSLEASWWDLSTFSKIRCLLVCQGKNACFSILKSSLISSHFNVWLTDVQEFLLRIRDVLGLVSSCDRKIRENHHCWWVTLHSQVDAHVTSFKISWELQECGYCTTVYIMYRKRRSFSQSSLPVTWRQLVHLKSGCSRGHDYHKLDTGFELCTSATGC